MERADMSYDYTVRYRHIPWEPYGGDDTRPLGRHVRHDSRSLNYLAESDGTVATTHWTRDTPILDQGSIGSCTGNATVGALGSDPFFQTLTDLINKGLVLNESEAVKMYSLATQLDSYQGTYPPTDTGSDGLSAAKAAQQLGAISGYQHITTLDAAHTAIQKSPFIVGSNWHSGMDSPDANGLVKATGSVRGGHEYECLNYDAGKGLWEFCNSWGTSFGVGGRFFYTDDTFQQLLSEDGDATVFTPLNQPAPTPTPPGPAPTPTPTPTDQADADLVAAGNAWERTVLSHLTKAGKLRVKFDAWKNAHGY